MKSPISNSSARRRSSSFEDLAHLLAAALHLEDEIDHAEGEATSRANENRLQITNNSEDQDQPSPSTIVTNAVPSVADLLASHGKEDLPASASIPFPSRRRRRGSTTTAQRRRSGATRRRSSNISKSGSICASLENEIVETLADKALVPISDSKECTCQESADPHFFPSGSNATKKAQAILHKKQGADAKDQFCGESFRLASFDPSRFVERGGHVVLKEESYRSFSNASA